MKQRIISYHTRIEQLLMQPPESIDWCSIDWCSIEKEHLTQIAFFQHERLIHLIVTVTFALLTMLSAAIFLIADYFPILLLTAAFLVLLLPYIAHYYMLENEVQKLYPQYDELAKRSREQLNRQR